jgi:hypothetical protein
MLQIQLNDNVKARRLGPGKPNLYRQADGPPRRSQTEIYDYLKGMLE